jgi:glycerophosphoryl diester phosphodiesterase
LTETLGSTSDPMPMNTPAARHPFFDHPWPMALAHRGGAEEGPENTMAAFENAVKLGFSCIEIDVQTTRDGVPLVFHDARLERMTDRTGAVSETTWEELRGPRVLGREPIPRLEEVLDAWPGVRYVIEPKSDRAVEPLADAVRRTGVLDRVCIGSFSDARVRRMRTLLGQRLCTSLGRRGVLRLRLASLGLPVGGFVEAAAQVPTRYRGLPVVDRQLLAAARRRGLRVQVWTVNEESEMDRLIDLGVDGIITDRPARLKAVLSRRGLWHG